MEEAVVATFRLVVGLQRLLVVVVVLVLLVVGRVKGVVSVGVITGAQVAAAVVVVVAVFEVGDGGAVFRRRPVGGGGTGGGGREAGGDLVVQLGEGGRGGGDGRRRGARGRRGGHGGGRRAAAPGCELAERLTELAEACNTGRNWRRPISVPMERLRIQGRRKSRLGYGWVNCGWRQELVQITYTRSGFCRHS